MPYIQGKFMVALWSKPTSRSPSHRKKTVDEKFKSMESAVKWSAEKAATIPTPGKGYDSLPFTAIFVAPEYFFMDSSPYARFPMDEGQKITLEQKVFELSRKYPHMVIVPGSYFYWKTAIRSATSSKLNNQGKVVPNTHKDRKVGALNKLANEWVREGCTEPSQYNSWFIGVNDQGFVTPSVDRKKEVLQTNPDVQILRNSTGLYLGGIRYGKYDKQADCYESGLPDDMVFVAGTKDECPQVRACRFGIEICLDHDLGRLKGRAPEGLHFHIVTSDFVDTKPQHMAMCNEGYFLHASSQNAETRLVYKDVNGVLHQRTKLKMNGPEMIHTWFEDWTHGKKPERLKPGSKVNL